MSSSLEIRPLFLDHELMEFVSKSMTYSKKIRQKPKKNYETFILITLILQKKKIGFEIPLFKLINENFKDDIIERLSKKNDFFSKNYKENFKKKIKKEKKLSEIKNIYIISKWLENNNITI